MSDDDPIFPNVRCAVDGSDAPGYAVCRHVAYQHALIAHYIEPTDRRLGEALCEPCMIADDLPVADLVLMCARCVDRLIAEAAPIP